jgi:hypothetical protein
MASAEDIEIEKLCQKCKRKISEHISTGGVHTIILYGSGCPRDHDSEIKDFAAGTSKKSGYDLENFRLWHFHYVKDCLNSNL